MLFQILKKDMIKRKGVNTILFLFITLATVFLSSSVNNILIISSAIDYYMEYASVPDVNIIVNANKEQEEIETWIINQQKDNKIDKYDYIQLLTISDKAITLEKEDNSTTINSNGASLYIGKKDNAYNKVFTNNGKDFTLQDGQIALSGNLMDTNDLSIGDTIYLQVKGSEKPFLIKERVKDAAFGNDMVGMSRIIVSNNDYETLSSQGEYLGLYYVMTGENSNFAEDLNNQAFSSVINTVSKDMYSMVYSFDMIMAALLILVGICLILIALLVLRFTLVFTMEEQYQEIGIMKALGFKNFGIKKLYLIKYLAIVSIGAILGLVMSFPISNMMIESVSSNMIMANSSLNYGVNIVCALVVVILVLGFCYFCTRKLNKVSVITAIRGGDTGERFTKLKGISLAKRAKLSVPIYLGINDIFCHMKRYAVLIIAFCISFILITIPLNTLNTMKSNEMLTKFLLDPKASVYVRNIEQPEEEKYTTVEQLTKATKRLQQELQNEGYKANFTIEPIYFFKFSDPNSDKKLNIMTIQVLGENTDFIEYQDGVAPVLENEIAISKTLMKENNWGIGDTVHIIVNNQERPMIITGSYSDYMQLGNSARLNPKISCNQEKMFDYWTLIVNMETTQSQKELAKIMQQKFPEYEWSSGQQLVDQNVGGIQDVLAQVVFPMTAMLCAIIMLITLLMEKLFITREKGEIAMMKSIGFSYQTICSWQIVRMVLVAITSLLISIPLSFLSNRFVLKPIFAIMGADVAIQVNPLQVYILYPGILLIGIIVATIIATLAVRRIDIRELNNIE